MSCGSNVRPEPSAGQRSRLDCLRRGTPATRFERTVCAIVMAMCLVWSYRASWTYDRYNGHVQVATGNSLPQLARDAQTARFADLYVSTSRLRQRIMVFSVSVSVQQKQLELASSCL